MYEKIYSTDTQKKRMLHYMREHGSITTWEATHYLDIMSPRKLLCRINEKTPLKKEIVIHKGKDTEGDDVTRRFVRYSLDES